MILALFRYGSLCLEPSSKINHWLKQTPDKKMIISIVTATVVPSLLWTFLMYYCDSTTGEVWHYRYSNSTSDIVAFQDVPEKEREKNGAVITLNCGAAAQLIITFLLYGKIAYTSYMSTLETVLKKENDGDKKTKGKLIPFFHWPFLECITNSF